MSKVLISFFSATGVTKGVAQKVAKAINGDLFKIEPTEKYTADSTYKSLKNNFPNLNFVDGKRFTGKESDDEYRNYFGG
ncbi:MAG: hypothetical protein IKG14_01550 [Clostridia bacterium]|nr:hypothetical protein [Clostridia bacterium]